MVKTETVEKAETLWKNQNIPISASNINYMNLYRRYTLALLKKCTPKLW